MNLSYKATQFIIEAIEYQIKAYQERLDREDLDEDEASDIINDSGFLEALCRDLRKNLNEGKIPDRLNSSDSSLVGIKERSSEELVKQILQLSMNERLLLVDAITESISQEFPSRQAQEPLSENFDSLAPNLQTDIVAVAPIRTIVRGDEEIVLIRRVRKVEETDESPSIQPDSDRTYTESSDLQQS